MICLSVIDLSHLFSRTNTSQSRYASTTQNLETEYIKQLQEQIYYLEKECLYLYPFACRRE